MFLKLWDMSYRRLGDMVKFISNKNTDGNATVLFGINIDKFFMPSVANIIGVDLKKYKVVKKHQFACNRMHVGRDERLPISMSTFDYDFIVSPAYDVFEVITSDVLPEYLMLWFRRKEFDRQCWFYTDADVRGGLHLDALKSIEIKVPSIVEQYQSVANKIKVNEQICEKLEATAQALYKHWFVDNKSNDWEVKKIGEVSEIKAGGDRPKVYSEIETEKCFIPIFSNGVTNEGLYGYTDKAIYPEKSITISARGTIGYCVLRNKPFVGIVRLLVVIPFNKYESTYLLECLRRIEFDNSGSVQNQLTIPQISTLEIIMPPETLLRKFDESVTKLNDLIEMKTRESQKLTQLQGLLLSRLAVGEEVNA